MLVTAQKVQIFPLKGELGQELALEALLYCELNRSITLGWASYRKVRKVWKVAIRMPTSLKRKAFNQFVLAVLIKGA